MKQHIAFTALIFFVSSFTSFANDTTLYQKRVEKIKTFLNWLKESPHKQGELVISDTSSIRRSVDTAINIFFDKRFLTEQYYPKQNLYHLRFTLNTVFKDSIILRTPEPSKDTLINAADFSDYFKNTIILYCPMYELEFECFYFVFAQNSTALIYFIQAGGMPEEYIEKKTFINNLQRPVR